MMRRNSSTLLALLLAGCTVGPKLPAPDAPLPETPGAGADTAPTPDQKFEAGVNTPREWWKSFESPELDALVAAALGGSQDLKAADAALRQAQALVKVARGNAGPQVDAAYNIERTRVSRELSPDVYDSNQFNYTLNTAQLSVTYPIDLFGAAHFKVKSARYTAQAQAARLLGARQTIAANTVNAAIAHAALVEQIDATTRTIAAAHEVLEMLRKRREVGQVGDSDIAAQETLLAAAEGQLPALVEGEKHQRALIAVLLGKAPGSELPPLPALLQLHVPHSLPVSLPGDVVANRPDVQAAGALVQGAAADVHATAAARFPQLTISGAAGSAAQNFGDMFSSPNLFWSIGGGILQPIFHAGALRQQQKAAQAAFDGALAQYRVTVLQAFVDVSDSLTALHGDALAVDAAERGANAAERSFGFVKRQAELGEMGSFNLRSAETALQQARITLVQARQGILSDSVALYQANGAPPEQDKK